MAIQHIKKVIAIVLVTTVLLPFAVQFFHSLNLHEYVKCETQKTTHIHSHSSNCSVFHFKINQNSVAFSSKHNTSENEIINEKPQQNDSFIVSLKFYPNLLRAPPFLLNS